MSSIDGSRTAISLLTAEKQLKTATTGGCVNFKSRRAAIIRLLDDVMEVETLRDQQEFHKLCSWNIIDLL